jgi:hypothetical protein
VCAPTPSRRPKLRAKTSDTAVYLLEAFASLKASVLNMSFEPSDSQLADAVREQREARPESSAKFLQRVIKYDRIGLGEVLGYQDEGVN